MIRLPVGTVVVLALLLLLPDSVLAQAGGGSSGFGGGGGGGGSGGGGVGGGGSGDGDGGGSFLLFALLFAGSLLWSALGTMYYRRRVRRRRARVRTAAAEAAEDDAWFAPEQVERDARELFVGAQEAWDRRDRGRLSQLIGKDLFVEWERRLDDFERKGWHNRVEVLGAPTIGYVGLTNIEPPPSPSAGRWLWTAPARLPGSWLGAGPRALLPRKPRRQRPPTPPAPVAQCAQATNAAWNGNRAYNRERRIG